MTDRVTSPPVGPHARLEPVTLEGARVRLEPLGMGHLGDLEKAGRDPSVWRWLPSDHSQPGTMRTFVQEALDLRDLGLALPFATVDLASGRAVGSTRYHEGRRGGGTREIRDQQLTQDLKTNVDAEYLRRASDFLDRSTGAGDPFFLYFNHSLMHFPMNPGEEFRGQSENGDWGDCLLMLDHDFGVLLDKLEELGVAENTIVVFAGDNGAENHLAGRGTGGFFDGSYFSSAEGGIRTPCLIRYPGQVPAGRETNGMVHVTDMFTTLLGWASCEVPQDRLIDGFDQRALFAGEKEDSARESCLVWLNEELHAVKWGQFKINFKRQQHFHDPELPLGFARITHLLDDPKEREPVNQRYVRWWVMQHARNAVGGFEESVRREGLIPSGAPLDFVPENEGTANV